MLLRFLCPRCGSEINYFTDQESCNPECPLCGTRAGSFSDVDDSGFNDRMKTDLIDNAIYDEAHNLVKVGKTLKDNPYEENSRESLSWLTGFYKGKDRLIN